MLRKQSSRRRPRRSRRQQSYECCCCRATPPFCWRCRRCGLQLCQACMEENRWGLTCNNITWQCPDCGQFNSFGNQ